MNDNIILVEVGHNNQQEVDSAYYATDDVSEWLIDDGGGDVDDKITTSSLLSSLSLPEQVSTMMMSVRGKLNMPTETNVFMSEEVLEIVEDVSLVDSSNLYSPPSSNLSILESPLTWSTEEIGAVSISSLMVPFILISNIVVIICVIKFRKLRTPTNYFVTSLAAVDIFVALATPFVILVEVFHLGDNNGTSNAMLCLLPNRMLMMACGVSVLTLAAIAYDRHTALVSPLKYTTIMTTRKVVIIVTLSWIYSIIIVWFPLMVRWYDVPSNVAPCSANLIHRKASILFLGAIFVPSCIAILICYFRIFMLARHHVKAIAAVELALQRPMQVKFIVKDTKYAKTLALIIGVFLLLWLPYLMYIFIKTVRSVKLNIWIQTYLTLLAVFNSGINPWIYAFMNSELRTALKRLFREFCRNRFFRSVVRRSSLVSGISSTPRLSLTDSRVISIIPDVEHDRHSEQPCRSLESIQDFESTKTSCETWASRKNEVHDISLRTLIVCLAQSKQQAEGHSNFSDAGDLNITWTDSMTVSKGSSRNIVTTEEIVKDTADVCAYVGVTVLNHQDINYPDVLHCKTANKTAKNICYIGNKTSRSVPSSDEVINKLPLTTTSSNYGADSTSQLPTTLSNCEVDSTSQLPTTSSNCEADNTSQLPTTSSNCEADSTSQLPTTSSNCEADNTSQLPTTSSNCEADSTSQLPTTSSNCEADSTSQLPTTSSNCEADSTSQLPTTSSNCKADSTSQLATTSSNYETCHQLGLCSAFSLVSSPQPHFHASPSMLFKKDHHTEISPSSLTLSKSAPSRRTSSLPPYRPYRIVSHSMQAYTASLKIQPELIVSRTLQPYTTTVQPNTTSSKVQPHIASSILQPHTTSTKVQPHIASSILQPHTTSTKVQPHITSSILQPNTTSPTVKPHITSSTVQPQIISSTLQPNTTSAKVQPHITSSQPQSNITSSQPQSNTTSSTLQPHTTSVTVQPQTISVRPSLPEMEGDHQPDGSSSWLVSEMVLPDSYILDGSLPSSIGFVHEPSTFFSHSSESIVLPTSYEPHFLPQTTQSNPYKQSRDSHTESCDQHKSRYSHIKSHVKQGGTDTKSCEALTKSCWTQKPDTSYCLLLPLYETLAMDVISTTALLEHCFVDIASRVSSESDINWVINTV